MADPSGSQDALPNDNDSPPVNNPRSDEELSRQITSLQERLVTMGLLGGDVPAEPVARFKHYDNLARLYMARFLADRSCKDEALMYSDQAKANIPPEMEGSLFLEPDGDGFGDRYLFLRVYAWHKEKSPGNARLLVDALEWKLSIASGSLSLQDAWLLALGKAALFRENKDAQELAGAIQACEDFIGVYQRTLLTVPDPEVLMECQDLYPSVLSCLSQLLYHEFRSTGKYNFLQLGLTMGNDVFIKVPDDERSDLAMSLGLSSIAYSFNYHTWDIPSRAPQEVLDWSLVDEEDPPSTVPETSLITGNLDPSKGIYQEIALASDNSQIRLLQLQAGTGEDPIVCFLKAVNLEGHPEYDALSYVWGNPGVTGSIQLHGREHSVTINLWDALKRLRQPDKHRRLWVDALCINQTDSKEKEGQIGLMGKIYSQAKEVCLWLGEPTKLDAFSDGPREIPCHATAAGVLKATFPTVYPEIRPYLSILEDGEFELVSSADPLDLTAILYRFPFSMRPIPSFPDDSLLSGSPPAPDTRHFSPETAALVRCTASMNLCMDFEDVLKRNMWHQDTEKPTPAYFNWGNESQIPWYLESKLSGVDWPISGAFVLVNLLAMDVHFHDLPFFGAKGYSCMSGHTAQAWNKLCYALYQILSSKYWSRAWILQEIVLADSPRIYFGKHMLPYHRLVRAMINFKRHYTSCCKDVVPVSQKSACEPQDWWMKLDAVFTSCIETTSEMWFERKVRSARGIDSSLRISDAMVANFKKRQATEPRDLIFSVLGMVRNDGPNAIPVDYSSPVEKVFSGAVMRALKESKQYATMFSFAGYGRSEKLKYKLPSWCVDLTSPMEWSGPFPEIAVLFNALPDVPGDGSMEADLCLSITSTKVDTVKLVSSTGQCCSHSGWDDTIHNIHQWRECASLPKDTRNLTMNSEEARFWTTILGGCLLSATATLHSSPSTYELINAVDLDDIPGWQAWLHDPGRSGESEELRAEYPTALDMNWLTRAEDFSRFNRRLHSSMMNKRFFVTEKGRFGAGPGSNDMEHFTRFEEGDEVHLLAGCKVPVILRSVKSLKGEGKKGSEHYGNDPVAFSADLETCVHEEELVYQLVGPCYVDGIMNGEAAREEGVSLRKIYLR
ncbi:hypothetical protein QBC38DRAFT_489218 [Podospora fimiseda]|uniref:Heterokaryon incompatibility domain-containing protein n=1 Tax=Podospora fimiseda TaxID=252190 RepID=A0AAN6YNU8_9PEZI|nr:hypothetical protein QBC38DRAFT_489218 [Podospora fimiseda]